MIKYMAVAVAVSGGGAVAVAGLTKRFFNHPKRFLNQCLGLFCFLGFAPADEPKLWSGDPLTKPSHHNAGSEI